MLGNIFGLATSALKLGIDANRAGKQRARAAQLIAESNQIKKTPLRKEFEQARRGADMMATQGLASTFTAKKMLDADAANNLRAIQQSSPSGAVASAAIASTIGAKNKATQELLARDAEFRTQGARQALNTLWQVGEKERDLEVEQRERQEALQRRAMALEDSALKRTEAAEGQFLKSATGALTSLGGGLDAGISAAIDFSNQQKQAKEGYIPTKGDAFTSALTTSLFGNKSSSVLPSSSDKGEDSKPMPIDIVSSDEDMPYTPKESRDDFLKRVFKGAQGQEEIEEEDVDFDSLDQDALSDLYMQYIKKGKRIPQGLIDRLQPQKMSE